MHRLGGWKVLRAGEKEEKWVDALGLRRLRRNTDKFLLLPRIVLRGNWKVDEVGIWVVPAATPFLAILPVHSPFHTPSQFGECLKPKKCTYLTPQLLPSPIHPTYTWTRRIGSMFVIVGNWKHHKHLAADEIKHGIFMLVPRFLVCEVETVLAAYFMKFLED